MALYAAAAAVLAGVESRQGSIKGLVYASSFQVAGLGLGLGARLGGRLAAPAPPQRVSLWPRAEREAAVRAGVRDAALLCGAGLGHLQRRPPPRREEASAAPGQGDGREEGRGGDGDGGRGAGWECPSPGPSALRSAGWPQLLGNADAPRSCELRRDENASTPGLA